MHLGERGSRWNFLIFLSSNLLENNSVRRKEGKRRHSAGHGTFQDDFDDPFQLAGRCVIKKVTNDFDSL
jgi:hypothetical protein